MNNITVGTLLIYNSISTILTYLFLTLTLGKPIRSNSLVLLVCMSYYVLINIVSIFSFGPYFMLLTNVVSMFVMTIVFNGKLLKKLFSVILAYTFLVLSEGIGTILAHILPISHRPVLHTIVRLFLCKAIVFFILLLLCIRNTTTGQRSHELSPKIVGRLICVPFLSILFICVYAYNIVEIDVFYLFLIILLVAINIVFFSLYNELAKSHAHLLQHGKVQLQNKYYSTYMQEIIKSQRQFRKYVHDEKNNLITLQSYIQKNKIEEAKKYLDDLLEYSGISNFTINSGNAEVDSLLTYMQSEACSHNITMICKVRLPQDIFISALDISIILGNLIDNAIEAAMIQNENHDNFINVKIKYEKSSLYICVENSAKNAVIITKAISRWNLPITSKMDKSSHGIGLSSVGQIAAKYNGTLEYHCNNDIFVIEVFLVNNAFSK